MDALATRRADALDSPFDALSLDACVREFKALETAVTTSRWRQAAICSSLQRRFGHRTDVTGEPTTVQVFCEQVGISRQKFWRLQRTFDAFHGQPRNPVLRGVLDDPHVPFKMFTVAALHAENPEAAVAEAVANGWNASQLKEHLQPRSRRVKCIPLGQLVAADWSFHRPSNELVTKLAESLAQHGQLETLLVRDLGDGRHEVIAGRQLLAAMQRIAWTKSVEVIELGPVSESVAKRMALSLEMQGETNYVKVAGLVSGLISEYETVEQATSEIAKSVPYSPQELQHFVGLLKFDWSRFDEKPSALQAREATATHCCCPSCGYEHRRPSPTLSRNAVFHRGPSQLTGDPILVVASSDSDNPKTGPVVQINILRSDMNPIEAVKSGGDRAICGDCSLRGDGTKGRACYVKYFQAQHNIFKALHHAENMTPEQLAARISGEHIRLGAYGDPVAVPLDVWRPMLASASEWTGYTHQWRTCDPEYRTFLQASVDSAAELLEARAKGWGTYRIRRPDEELEADEIVCPASEEAGHRTTCKQCGICCGTTRGAKSVSIIAHGPHAKWFLLRPVGHSPE